MTIGRSWNSRWSVYIIIVSFYDFSIEFWTVVFFVLRFISIIPNSAYHPVQHLHTIYVSLSCDHETPIYLITSKVNTTPGF